MSFIHVKKDEVKWEGMNRKVGVLLEEKMAGKALGLAREEVLEAHIRAAELKPGLAAVYNNMGGIYQEQGKFEKTAEAHNKAIATDENFAPVYLACRKFKEEDAGFIDNLQRLLERDGIKEEETASLRFALGKINDDLGRYEKAFFNYKEANRIENKKYEFDREKHAGHISRIMETFTPEFFAERRNIGAGHDLPIMVLGMIRSGTTLVEQIISSHPRVHGAGELNFWNDIEKKHNPDGVAGPPEAGYGMISGETALQIAQKYVDCLRSFSKTAWHITDKTPGNFLCIGLIHLVFPKARIIHLKRNPVDTCLSIYFHKFAGYHPYGYDLDNLVFYYRQYQRLMEHWRGVLPTDVFHEVQYEDLVKEHEKTSRELIGFCELPWDERCLRFHQTERPVKTCSNWQVRQPIYKSYTARWKRYEPYLGPLSALLTEK